MMKKIKLSHSSMNKFSQCPRSYQYRYVDRIVSKYKSGALYFGSALDAALNELLTSRDLGAAKFVLDENWNEQPDNTYLKVQLSQNETIVYAKADFDADLLEKSDWAKLYATLKEMNIQDSTPMGAKFRILDEKHNKGWENLKVNDQKFYNYMNWLCLRRKGHFMLDAYYNKILPKIKEVLVIQKNVSLVAEDGDEIQGFVDLLAIWEDGTKIVFDNKTSAMEYEADSVRSSPQLALYKMLIESEGEHNPEKAGFLVLRKNLKKDITKVCKTCGFKAEEGSSHKTCYHEVETQVEKTNKKGEVSISTKTVRCNGEWDKTVKFDAEVQIIIDNVSEAMQNMVLENVNDINTCVRNNVYPRNLSGCETNFGKCDYFQKCHFGKESNLIKLEEKQ